MAHLRRPTFKTARPKPADQDMGLNVSKVASISATRAAGIGQERLQPIGGLKAAQIWLGKPVGSWRRAPVAAGLALP